MSYLVEKAGGAALACLRAGPATVFASFDRSCYVETPAGIACVGGAGLGLGPLNAILKELPKLAVGDTVAFELENTKEWHPTSRHVTDRLHSLTKIGGDWQNHAPVRAFLRWLAGEGEPEDTLIGLGAGLTPSGDDFVGGAMIALRRVGETALADRIAAWALPLAATNTNRISRAHLACAALGEGHECLHDFLCSPTEANLDRLARLGHTSGLDAAAGAMHALAGKNIIAAL
jgi:hypothetical protein